MGYPPEDPTSQPGPGEELIQSYVEVTGPAQPSHYTLGSTHSTLGTGDQCAEQEEGSRHPR